MKYQILLGAYAELRRCTTLFNWELDTIIKQKNNMPCNNLWHFQANNNEFLFASTGAVTKKIQVKRIPISKTYECSPFFNFKGAIQKAWIETGKPKKEYEQREMISGGNVNENSEIYC